VAFGPPHPVLSHSSSENSPRALGSHINLPFSLRAPRIFTAGPRVSRPPFSVRCVEKVTSSRIVGTKDCGAVRIVMRPIETAHTFHLFRNRSRTDAVSTRKLLCFALFRGPGEYEVVQLRENASNDRHFSPKVYVPHSSSRHCPPRPVNVHRPFFCFATISRSCPPPVHRCSSGCHHSYLVASTDLDAPYLTC